MKKFETPVVEIEKFKLLDVIATSTEEENELVLEEDLTKIH